MEMFAVQACRLTARGREFPPWEGESAAAAVVAAAAAGSGHIAESSVTTCRKGTSCRLLVNLCTLLLHTTIVMIVVLFSCQFFFSFFRGLNLVLTLFLLCVCCFFVFVVFS